MPTGIDQSWGYASPKAARAAGVEVVSMYLSWDASKNITPAKVKAYHGVGIGVALNWEHAAGAPLLGAAQGRADAVEAVRQAKALIAAVGYKPKNRVAIYFSCDRDVTVAQAHGAIAAYYRAARDVCHAAGFGVGVYGEADLVEYLAAAKITDAEWQTYAWSGGRLVAATDFYQYDNGQTLGGASVDFDRVIHAADMGAWWPPSHKLNAATNGDDEVTDDDIKKIARAVWNIDMIPIGTDPKNPTWAPVNVIKMVYAHALAADGASKSNGSKLDAVAQVLSTPKTGILARVAALQASVDAVAKTVAAITPGAQVAVDAAKIASATADAVVAKVKALSWKAAG